MEIHIFITAILLSVPVDGDLVCEGLKSFLRERRINTIPAPMARVTSPGPLLSCVLNCTALDSCRSYNFKSKQCILLDENDKPLQKGYRGNDSDMKARKQDTTKPDTTYTCSQIGYTFASTSKTCVKLYKKELSWDNAVRFCRRLKGSLVIIKTTQKQVLLSIIARKAYAGRVWIGAKDMHNTDTYEWCDGSGMNYTAWGNDEPSHRVDFPFMGGEENCVEMMNWKKYRWNDSSCQKRINFFCEMKAVN